MARPAGFPKLPQAPRAGPLLGLWLLAQSTACSSAARPLPNAPANELTTQQPNATTGVQRPTRALHMRWVAEVGLSELNALQTALERAVPNRFGALSNGKSTERPDSCITWAALRNRGYRALPHSERAADIDAHLHCVALTWLQQAQPATTSHLRDVAWSADIRNVLPARISDPCTDPSAGNAAQHLTLAALMPDSTATPDSTHRGLRIDIPEAWSLLVRPLAWADFNKDGLEDVLVAVDLDDHLQYRDALLLLLSRNQADGKLQLLEASCSWQPTVPSPRSPSASDVGSAGATPKQP